MPAVEETVRYRSSRAPAGAPTASFPEALQRGLAPDGGLYLPCHVPPLPAAWADAATPAALGACVLPPWTGWSEETLAPLLQDALSFPWPLRRLDDDVWLLELFHGPTLSFKDVGARTMARSLAHAAGDDAGRRTVLVATSGDTGSAVADGFAGVPGVRVVLLYPKGRVSPVQERQLTVAREGVRTFAVEGTFDDCQRLAKGAFADEALQGLGLTSANSINVGRLLPQALYYLWAARSLRREWGVETPPRFVVPSGNLGNLTAGLLAERMGLATRGWLAAHNANGYFPAYLQGEREPYDFLETVRTLSNAMDVGAPSNFERLHALFGGTLAGWIRGVSVDDAATRERMRASDGATGVAVCPHTAVGLEAAARAPASAGTPTVVLATAHPAKFPEAVRQAVGHEPRPAPALEALAAAPHRSEPLPARAEALRDALLSGS